MIKPTLILVLLLTFSAKAQQSSELERSASPLYKQSFQYQPQNTIFWKEFNEHLDKGELEEAKALVEARIKTVRSDNLEGAEARMALARYLVKKNLSFAASYLLKNLIKNIQGTNLSWQALMDLESIVKSYPVDEAVLYGETVYDVEHVDPPLEIASFVYFLNGQYNKVKNFSKWAEADFKNVNPESHWGYLLNYQEALRLVEDNKLDAALDIFAMLFDSEKADDKLKNDAKHQFARILFEKGEFDRAYELLKEVNLDPRARGMVLLERAWSKYYLKDYSKALGLLVAMEAPPFKPSMPPEAYVLKMLMFKELCYYNSALRVFNDFKKRYAASLKKIKSRADLVTDTDLVQLAVLNPDLMKKANYYNLLKREFSSLTESSLSQLEPLKNMTSIYEGRITEYFTRLKGVMEEPLRVAANELLDWQEQLSFLDYQSRIDSLRVTRPASEVDFKSEEISTAKFDKIFWIFNGEYWMDEIENLETRVVSRCAIPPGRVR